MIFQNRVDAGRRLAERLMHLKGQDPVVLALPRGGVPVAAVIAEALGAALDLLIVRKIGAPGFSELAVGAVIDGAKPMTVLNEGIIRELGVSSAYLEQTTSRELAEIGRRRSMYLRGRLPVALDGRAVLVVDDGIATGATMRVALRALAAGGVARRVALAVPVAPPKVAEALLRLCDEAVFLITPSQFRAVGQHYVDFTQTEDAEVISLLDQAAARISGAARHP
ncbi:phosphoribosyltransferase [Roseomonas xinghualingensis]|uniref:phosphoribosyltransferase n=1 Tax=Roseomonas xinghualingensis TaxID=2986475 RepID=UPI0021F0C908|nr:phosphoribosyltransferase family protein [Roseomonas sp. SXEYE001]MCV4209430.1 phosphoribosyltransferase family protein [Roseomonas sp. SXEYE001]